MENIKHTEEEKIKQLLFYEEGISDKEKEEILSHINTCKLCKEIYNEYKSIVEEINIEIDLEPTENDKEFAKKYLMNPYDERRKLLPESKSYVQVINNNYEIINVPMKLSLRYFINIIKNNPVKSAVLFILAGLILSFIIIYPSKPYKDNNPVFTEIVNKKLKIYNKKADILWEIGAFGISELSSYDLMHWIRNNKKFVSFDDINNDGINEVLISGDTGGISKNLFRCDSVYCYNNLGELRWVSGGESPFDSNANKWKNTGRFIRDFFITRYGNKTKLFIIGNDNSYSTAFISEINPENGKVVSTLYHLGWFSSRINVDLENDGNEEIIITGTSSNYKPSILVLKTENIYGIISEQNSLDKEYEKGNAYAYILLPIRDLSKINNDFKIGIDTDLKRLGENGFYINTPEVYREPEHKTLTGILYAFNNKLEISNISFSTEYSLKYNRLYEEGLVKEKLDSAYCKMLKDSVLYWNGDKFVHYPTTNKYYKRK